MVPSSITHGARRPCCGCTTTTTTPSSVVAGGLAFKSPRRRRKRFMVDDNVRGLLWIPRQAGAIHAGAVGGCAVDRRFGRTCQLHRCCCSRPAPCGVTEGAHCSGDPPAPLPPSIGPVLKNLLPPTSAGAMTPRVPRRKARMYWYV